MSLPVSFLGAFFFVPHFDLTINMLSMVGLLLALGLLGGSLAGSMLGAAGPGAVFVGAGSVALAWLLIAMLPVGKSRSVVR